jgi:hypothetical protein
MAKRSNKPVDDGSTPVPPADELFAGTPSPPEQLHVTFTSLSQGDLLHRVHLNKYRANEFNPGVHGNARFSPIRNPATRKWAEAIHRQCPQVQGLSWVSRQDDSARAVVLFGDRVSESALRPDSDSHSLVEDANTYDSLLDLADRIGVNVVRGKS